MFHSFQFPWHLDVARAHTGQETKESVTNTIVAKIAACEGAEPTKLRSLHDVIDPDALNAVFATIGPVSLAPWTHFVHLFRV